MATTDTGRHAGEVKRIPPRRDASYQFPVYRWLSWLCIAGYAAGLGCMYLIAGMFGIPAPLGWAFLVILFCAGISLLELPTQLLQFMVFYFLLMPNNRLLGLLGLPLPDFLDELFFVPFIAVIVMSMIQRNEMPAGLWFATAFMGVSAVSWYVNGRPSPFTAVQVTLITLKFFIIWYFCRLTSSFQNLGQFWKWGEFYIHYAAAQFLYNCLWQRAPWPTIHPDHSGGVFGPEGTGAAHYVGYISILALFLLAGWWIGAGRAASKRKRSWMLFLGLVITYDLVFMTDTKHGVLLMPLAFSPILFHRGLPSRLRATLLVGGGIITIVAFLFLSTTTSVLNVVRMGRLFLNSPKGDAYLAVTRDFHYLVPYPVLGAGPGRFFSGQAVTAGAPLARRYVTPYRDEANRARLEHSIAARTGNSMLAWPQCGFLTLMGEFGWLGTAVYMGFLCHVFAGLWRKANQSRGRPDLVGGYLSLACGLVFLTMTIFVASTETIGCLMFPWWMLIGRIWDMPDGETLEGEALSFPATGRKIGGFLGAGTVSEQS